MIMQLNRRLAMVFGELSKTLFFEYPTLAAVARVSGGGAWLCAARAGQGWKNSRRQRRPMPAVAARAVGRRKPWWRAGQWCGEAVVLAARRGADRHHRDERPLSRRAQTWRSTGANLRDGKDCIVEIGNERWPLQGFYDADAEEAAQGGKSYSKWGGFIEGVDEFDPLFFNISPREAGRHRPAGAAVLCRAAGRRWRMPATRARVAAASPGPCRGVCRDHQDRVCAAWSGAGGRRWASLCLNLVRLGGQPGIVSVEPARSEHADGHDVLVVADGDPPGVRASLRADECELALAGGVNLSSAPSELCPALRSVRMLSKRRAVQELWRRAGTAMCPAKGWGWCC